MATLRYARFVAVFLDVQTQGEIRGQGRLWKIDCRHRPDATRNIRFTAYQLHGSPTHVDASLLLENRQYTSSVSGWLWLVPGIELRLDRGRQAAQKPFMGKSAHLASIMDPEVIAAARYLLASFPRGRAIAAIARENLQRRHARICQLIGVEIPLPQK
jgi:hypothetical protein